MPTAHMTSEEAADFLGISKASLYSYVSRGMIRTLPAEQGSRRKLYDRSDLDRLKHLKSYRTDPDRAASEVMEFGKPILATSISLITENEHSYRGIPSRNLAIACSFEQVAEFLWTGSTEEGSSAASPRLPPATDAWNERIRPAFSRDLPAKLSPVEKLQSLLPMLEHDDLAAYAVLPTQLVHPAIRIIRYLTLLSANEPYRGGVALTLAKAWGIDAGRLDRLLVVTADHELNIATFTARCAASAGSNIYQSVLAGLAALQGHKHLLGQIVESKAFFAEVLSSGSPEQTIRRYLRNEGAIPGFHNPYRRLYPGHDPRVGTLLSYLSDTPNFAVAQETIELVEAATGEPPRVDFALGVSEILLELPEDAIFNVVAIARTAGMVAHIIEQYATNRVIRPRAKYVPEGQIESLQ